MDNNDILKKLRVALMLRDEQIVEILELVDFRITKTELSAFFRNADHPNFVECGDQVLRNFLNGLVIHLRGSKDEPKNPMDTINKNREHATPKEQIKFPKDINTKNAATGKAKPAKPYKKNAPNKATPKIQIVEKVKFNNGKNKKS